MTSASELFYTRRSRLGRNSLDLGLNSSLDRSFHHHSHTNRRHNHNHINNSSSSNNNNNNSSRRDRHDLDGCDPLRRPAITRHQSHRPSNSERDTVRFNEGGNQTSSGNNIALDNSGSIHNSPRLNGNDRLPGAVLLARERLLQRLRGVYLSGNRRTNSASSDINRNDLTLGDEFRLVDAGDWETEIPREWFSGSTTPFTDPISQGEPLLVPQQTTTRPPGLTQEAVNSLLVEVFGTPKCGDERETSRALQECSICLESFLKGDELTCLPCAHRFHSSCLDPWVRTCGDCPYCRSGIVDNIRVEQ